MDHHLLLLSNFEHFSGAGIQNWETWVHRFEAKISTLPAADWLPCLISVLQGGALDFLASLPDRDRADYAAVTAALRGRFGQLRSPLQAQVELARVRQQPGESELDFADRVRQLGRLAHPQGAVSDMTVEVSLKSLFICGLNDAGLQSLMCHRNPDTLDAAVNIAREFQCQRDALLTMRQPTAGGHGDTAPQVMVTSNAGSGGDATAALQSLERRVDDIQQTLRRLCTDDSKRPPAGPRSNGNDGIQRRGGRSPVRCFDCGDPNHIRRFCPGRRVSAEGRQCFACGGMGHLFRDCSHTNAQARRPFCLRCRRDGHWMADCSRSPAAMGGSPACAGAGQAQGQGN